MEANDMPPLLADASSTVTTPSVARWRWWVHVFVLALFPLLPILLTLLPNKRTVSGLPHEVPGLLLILVIELGLFTVFFLIAWLASRISAAQLMLKWRGGMPVVWGLLYSVAIRVVILCILFIGYICWLVIQYVIKGRTDKIAMPAHGFVDDSALTNGTLYLVVAMTLLSFVMGGLREEIWRSAMLAGIKSLFPRQFDKLSGRIIAVLAIAVLFGLGHLVSQGWIAAVLIGILGAILGGIMLWHRSIWEAVWAHGFFDASTFAFVFLIAKYAPQLLHPQ
jgi:membrane protease YdiL (CAAX protease family)